LRWSWFTYTQRLFRRWRHGSLAWLYQAWKNGALFYLIGMLLIASTWLNPSMQLPSRVQDTLFVIDITESMNVTDVDYPRHRSSRLSLAKAAVNESMASLPCGSRVSVGLFAGDETVILFEPLEICRHFSAIEQVVSRLDTRMRWIGDSRVTRALLMAMKEAEKRQLNVVMLTDGDEMPHRTTPRLNELMEQQGKVKGLMLGIGEETAQPVPKVDERGNIIGYWTPEEAVLEGNHPNLLAYVKALPPGERAPAGTLDEVGEHLSALNQTTLRAVASATRFDYHRIRTPNDAVSRLNQTTYQQDITAERDARWILGLLATVSFMLAWFWHRIRGFMA